MNFNNLICDFLNTLLQRMETPMKTFVQIKPKEKKAIIWRVQYDIVDIDNKESENYDTIIFDEEQELEKVETFEVPDYSNFMYIYDYKFTFLNKRGTRKFYMWMAGNIHLEEVRDDGYFTTVKEYINEPISKESYEKARKMCYDLYLDKEEQDESVCDKE